MTEVADHRAARARRSRGGTAVVVASSLLACGIASGQVASPYAGSDRSETPLGTRFNASVSTELLWTNNVSLNAGEERESDFVFTLTPRVGLDHVTDRTLLRGIFSLPVYLYARTGDANNQVLPEVDLFGKVELVDRFLFVDAAVNVHQQFFTPFGSQPIGQGNRTDNQYTSQSYQISPYIEGRPTGSLRYLLRYDNLWSDVSDAPTDTGNFYTNIVTGLIERDPTPLGWGLDLSRKDYQFEDQSRSQTLALVRARGIWQPDAQLRVHLSGGYEQNRFPLSNSDGAIYGAGIFWRPSERTLLNASYERRFFGPSYQFTFEHRTRNLSWSAQASRNITSYPEQLAALPAGSFVPGILDAIFQSRIADPLERSRFISQYMDDRGLPLFLTDPTSIYAQQIYLSESASTAFGIIGVRNSVLFNVFYLKTEAIAASGSLLPPQINAFENNTQVGANVQWTYQVSPMSAFTWSTNVSRTDALAPFTGKTDQWGTELRLTHPLTAKTTAYAGARYQSFKSDFERDYTEAAVFVGATYSFR